MTEIRRREPGSSTAPLAPKVAPTGSAPLPAAAPTRPEERVVLGSQVVGAQRAAQLTGMANRAAVMAAQATREYMVATIAGDEPGAGRAQDQSTTQLGHYQGAVRELKDLGQAYQPPQLPAPDSELLVRQALLKKFESRLNEAKGHPLRTVGAELRNELEAVGVGLAGGLSKLWHRVEHFVQHPVGDAKQMFVDAASLLLHPLRNLNHLMQAVHRFGGKSRYEQVMDVADVIPSLVLAPAVVPLIADAKEGIRRSEKLASDRLLERIAIEGADAPPGRTAIGTAVNRAVWGTQNGTMARDQALTRGVIDEIWQNDPAEDDEILKQACALIREARTEVCLQTYIFDRESPAARELYETLAARQREVPGLKIHMIVDRPGVEEDLARYGIRAEVAAARPLVSRRGHHTKMFAIDGKIGVIGGDNIDNPRETDLMIKVRGPVVRAMLADFDDAWRLAANHPMGSATPPVHPVDPEPEPANAVPLSMLGKRGELGFYAPEYTDNDADQGLLAALAAARHEIKLMSPNLNSDVVLAALRDAALRGVKVKIQLPLDYNGLGAAIDAATNRAFLAFVAELPAEARAHLELRNFSTNGTEGERAHTKLLVVDGEWAYVGSQNMDNQSFSFSRELGVGVDDPEQSQRLAREVFDRTWATSLPTEPGWFARLMPHAFFDH